jgi:PepSY-associated TM region
MMRPAAVLKRSLIFVHRWLGVALSLIFLLWFVSGIVMMYWTYPEVTADDRLQRAPVLDPTTILVPPENAYAALGSGRSPRAVCLNSFDGRPVYRFDGGCGSGDGAMVYADDGTVPRVDDAMIDRAAAAWTGLPVSEAVKESVEEVDQWTVGELRTVRPLYKYSWPDGQQLYVNGNTAEVAQFTTTASRFWAYLGAIPHWLYFTPLRKHPPRWFSFVVWSSLIGTVAALMGVVIAIWMYSPSKRYRHAGVPTGVPYRGWKRWHMITGLCFGVMTTTWAFSGLLSMGPFPIMSRLTELAVRTEPPTGGAVDAREYDEAPDVEEMLRGRGEFRLASYAAKPARAAIASIPDFGIKELEYTSFAGKSFYLAFNGQRDTQVIPVTGATRTSFDIEEVVRVVREGAGRSLAELRVIDEYDAYYLDRHLTRPLPVVYARMNDRASTRYYIDPKVARVAGTYDSREWVSRWLYHALHSLDFPWLYKYRPLWDIVVITLMLGGTAVCVTSIVMTWRVLARTLVVLVLGRPGPPDEDLARMNG